MRHLTLSTVFIALFSTCVQAGDDPYGRLFTTPDQRARLDNRFNGHTDSSDSQTNTTSAEAQAPRPLKVNGTLVSSVGKKEVWINGESQLAPGDKSGSRVRLLNTDRVRVKPSSSGKAHDMKPGQVLDPNTGTVSEAYLQAQILAPNTDNTNDVAQQALTP